MSTGATLGFFKAEPTAPNPEPATENIDEETLNAVKEQLLNKFFKAPRLQIGMNNKDPLPDKVKRRKEIAYKVAVFLNKVGLTVEEAYNAAINAELGGCKVLQIDENGGLFYEYQQRDIM